MKTIITASFIAAAALSLGACSKSDTTANTTAADVTLNESDIPAEGNLASDDFINASGEPDNAALENSLSPVDNAGAASVNGL